jgi:hypothetical protein
MNEGNGDERSNEIVRAYLRGAEWMRENAASPEYVTKAACDYADFVTSCPKGIGEKPVA